MTIPERSENVSATPEPRSAAGGQRNPNEPQGSLFGRMFAFVVLATCVNLWLEHHLGFGIGNPKLLGAIGASLVAAMGLLDRLAEKAEQESFRRRIRAFLRPALAPPVLALLFLVAGILALSYSSLTVLPESGAGALRVTVTAAEEASVASTKVADGPGEALRFPLRVTSFGRSFRVEADGYLSERFEVLPLSGLRIQAGRDLVPLPSLLLRPPPLALRSLRTGGTLHLLRIDGDQRKPVIHDASGATSFLIGRPRPLPSTLYGQWRLELAAQELDEASLSRILLTWSSPTVIEPLESIRPGMRLEAEVRTRAGKLRARAAIIVGDEKLSDIPLIGVEGGI